MNESSRPAERPPLHTVVIIGAGPGGICAGAILRRRGITDFLILERADDVGGSWRDNDYPGIGVDVPSFTYQYSFAKNPRWSRLFPKGAEVLQYHRGVARRFDLYRHTRFGVSVVREEWDETGSFWRLHTDDGRQVHARFVISAVGAYLREKVDPGIPGFASFAGTTLRPTAWDHAVELQNKRVAVVGTGASAVQIVPAIARRAGHLDVYQRTPVWCLPKPDLRLGPSAHRLLALPGVGHLISGAAIALIESALQVIVRTPSALFEPGARLFDAASRGLYRGYLRTQVKESATVRDALMPDYGPFGKRPTLSNEFLRSFDRADVALHPGGVDRITPTGVVTNDGVEHPADILVLATGYELFSDPESYHEGAVVGREGFDLGRFFAAEHLQAYQSVALPKLPNRWMLVGPYSWTGTGWHLLVEISAGHAVAAIAEALAAGADAAEVRQESHDAYHHRILRQERNIRTYYIKINRGLRTYYVNSQGDMPYIRPTSLVAARWRSRHVRFSDYSFECGPTLATTEIEAATG